MKFNPHSEKYWQRAIILYGIHCTHSIAKQLFDMSEKKQSFDLNGKQLFGLLREKNEISYFLGCQIDIVHVFMTPYIKSKIKRKLRTQRKLQKSNKNSKYQTKLLLCKNQMFLFI